MNILLINIPYEKSYCSVKSAKGKFPPASLAYLAAFLRKSNNVKILDAANLDIKIEDIPKYIQKNVDVIGISLLTPLFNTTLRFLKILKKIRPNCYTIVGGPHISALPNETLKKNQYIDFGIIGEGEIPFLKLIKCLESRKNYEKINGLIYRKDGEIIVNKVKDYIKNLDILPYPAYDLLPMKVYSLSAHHAWSYKKINFKPWASIFSSRGCLYDCTFCASKVVWGRNIRYKSAEYFISEIDYLLKEFNIKTLEISDDSFLTNKERVNRILDLLIERNYDLNFSCMARVDEIDEAILIKLKKAKCYLLRIGVESCDDHILRLMKKGITIKKIKRAFKMIKKAGIACSALIMVGYPGETFDSFNRTLKILKKLNPTAADFYITIPIVGTELYKLCLKKGYIVNNKWEDWIQMTSNPSISTGLLRSKDLLKLRRKAYTAFYLRFGYIVNVIKNIRSIEQIKFLWRGFLAFFSLVKYK